jgi:hypothetical protein
VGRHGGDLEGHPEVGFRIGAVALPLVIIVFVVSTAIHPSREAPIDNRAIFMEYAQRESAPSTSPNGWELCCYSVVSSLFTTPLRESQKLVQ